EEVPESLEYPVPAGEVVGGIVTDEEEQILRDCNDWVIRMGLSEGYIGYELIGDDGELLAVVDLAWPEGLQEGLSDPVALLIDEGDEVEELLNHAGFRYYTTVESFKEYVENEILATDGAMAGAQPMANMYPSYLQTDKELEEAGLTPISSAERRLFDLFKRCLSDDYSVFHGVLLQAPRRGGGIHDREIDFLIAHPEYGLLTIEVKGGLIQIDGTTGKWTSRDRYGKVHNIKNP